MWAACKEQTNEDGAFCQDKAFTVKYRWGKNWIVQQKFLPVCRTERKICLETCVRERIEGRILYFPW